MKPDRPHILAVNPWIDDFAAYDYWATPLGLLSLLAIARQHGCRISYIDCLDRFHPKAKADHRQTRAGRGPFVKTPLPKPAKLASVPRRYSRYGIRDQWFDEALKSVASPDLIWVSCMMTYWYPGLQATIAAIRRRFADVPIVLGGVYASLCTTHARAESGADEVVVGAAETRILKLLHQYCGFHARPCFDPQDLATYPYPAFDMQRQLAHVPLLTSTGCPYRCAYCASKVLQPERRLRDPASVVAEIEYWHRRFGVIDFAIYDDALLVDPENHVLPLLEGIVRSGLPVRFHTPNALHIRYLRPTIVNMLHRAGFDTIRLGLETADFDRSQPLDHKVASGQFEWAVNNLKNVGFRGRQVGAYLLAGLPGQSFEQVRASFNHVLKFKVRPVLAYYSPIPKTALWESARLASGYDLKSDPLFCNNAIFPCWPNAFEDGTIQRLKMLARSQG